MPVTPPAAIASPVDDDPIDPGPQRSPTLKATDRTKDTEEHLLGQIEDLIVAAEELIAQRIDHLLVSVNQLSARGLVARRASSGQRDIFVSGGNTVGPFERSRLLYETVPSAY